MWRWRVEIWRLLHICSKENMLKSKERILMKTCISPLVFIAQVPKCVMPLRDQAQRRSWTFVDNSWSSIYYFKMSSTELLIDCFSHYFSARHHFRSRGGRGRVREIQDCFRHESSCERLWEIEHIQKRITVYGRLFLNAKRCPVKHFENGHRSILSSEIE